MMNKSVLFKEFVNYFLHVKLRKLRTHGSESFIYYNSSVWLCGLNFKCNHSGHINVFVNFMCSSLLLFLNSILAKSSHL